MAYRMLNVQCQLRYNVRWMDCVVWNCLIIGKIWKFVWIHYTQYKLLCFINQMIRTDYQAVISVTLDKV